MRALKNTKTRGGLPRKWRVTLEGEIRSGYGVSIMCPLAAVAEAPTTFGYPPEAIRQLGLRPQVGQDIWDASDFGARLNSKRINSIRAEIIKALKLKDREDYY